MLLPSLLLQMVLQVNTQSDAHQTTHVLIIHDSDGANLEAGIAVMTEVGVDLKQATAVVNAVRENGEAIVAQGPETSMTRLAIAFSNVGMKATVSTTVQGASLYRGFEPVLEAADADALEALMNDGEPLLVKFYGSSCPMCHAMADEYKKAASELKGRVQVVAVNLQALPAGGGKGVAEQLAIMELPTVRFVQGGDNLDYAGDRSASSLVEFALKALEQLASRSAPKTPELVAGDDKIVAGSDAAGDEKTANAKHQAGGKAATSEAAPTLAAASNEQGAIEADAVASDKDRPPTAIGDNSKSKLRQSKVKKSARMGVLA